MRITSQNFAGQETIPSKYSCDGENINPGLNFIDIPEGAKSLALIMDDPDAPSGMFVHWVLFNIAPSADRIEENSVPKGAVQGKNGAGKNSYTGPCPPSGTHRYFFKLYALDTKLELSADSDKTALEQAMQNHIIEEAQIMGIYSRGGV